MEEFFDSVTNMSFLRKLFKSDDDSSDGDPSDDCPFSWTDKQISAHIQESHSSEAVRHEVEHLYHIVSNMIKQANSDGIIDERLDLKVNDIHPLILQKHSY